MRGSDVSEARVLVVYHSVEGQTERVAARIDEVLRDEDVEVVLARAADAPSPDGFDGVVAGGSIHASNHSRQLTGYLRDHHEALNALPAALFQVSLTSADESPEKMAEAGQYVSSLLDATGFDPDIVARFAGALAYTRYGYLKRKLMVRIAGKDGGDVDTSRDHDYTDWEAVEAFARDVAAYVRSEAG